MFQPIVTDVVIIGAGPVGLFSVFECGMLKMRCHVVDTLDAIGGQCTALYPEKPIYDIPGFPRIAAGELVDSLTRQAAPFRPVYHLGQTVTRLHDRDDGSIEVALSGGDTLVARAVIIAAGGGTLGPNRPPLKGIEGYEGRHVIYRITRVEALRGRRIVVAGGGDSAVDWTLALLDVAERVMLVHRRHKFRAAPASVDTLLSAARQGRVDLVTPYQLHGLEGDGRVLTGITVADEAGDVRRLEADTLLALFGISNELGPIAGWGLQLEHQQIVVTPGTSETSRPGVYAVGDVAAYPSKLKLILTGFAEAAAAAHAIHARVHPGEVLHFEHSTTVGVPGLGPAPPPRTEAVAVS
ncbi:MAG: NAD(P)/FAD-dependent oxidoreductase [Betaproteobacteria bacterium]|nr:NAD(P)/FAD-dependent oxidoreductase [Betaproteobacteria bacterium]